MQKIHFYLVPNRITVTTDMAGFNTEFKQVYQRKIKLHKGIDNTIQLEVRNADQRKQNVVGHTVTLKFFDAARKLVFTATGDAIMSMPGLMSVTITADTIANVDPQLLTVAAFINDGSTDAILYGDTDFNVMCTVEILNAYNEISDIVDEVTVFNYEYDKAAYTSEIALFGPELNNDYLSTSGTKTVTFDLTGTYDGTIQVEVTKNKSTANSNTWTRLDDWNCSIETSKTYTASSEYRYVRFIHRGHGPGQGATFTVTVNNNSYDRVDVIYRGQNYMVGDTLRILGSRLGGDDGYNDLTITVAAVNVYPQGSLNSVDGITWSGTAGVTTGYYRNVGSDYLISSKPVDKITVRS